MCDPPVYVAYAGEVRPRRQPVVVSWVAPTRATLRAIAFQEWVPSSFTSPAPSAVLVAAGDKGTASALTISLNRRNDGDLLLEAVLS